MSSFIRVIDVSPRYECGACEGPLMDDTLTECPFCGATFEDPIEEEVEV